MRVRLLGPVDVMDGGEVLPVSGLRRKAVLATLAGCGSSASTASQPPTAASVARQLGCTGIEPVSPATLYAYDEADATCHGRAEIKNEPHKPAATGRAVEDPRVVREVKEHRPARQRDQRDINQRQKDHRKRDDREPGSIKRPGLRARDDAVECIEGRSGLRLNPRFD